MGCNKRIVLAGRFSHGAVAEAVAHGLRSEGWDVHNVNLHDFTPAVTDRAMRTVSKIVRTFRNAPYEAAILDAAKTVQPTAFLTVKGQFLSAALLAKLRTDGIVTANYYPDFHFDHAGVDAGGFRNYDLFLTTKSFQVEPLRKALGLDRVHHVHHGYSPLVHRPRNDNASETSPFADVAYFGTYTPYKARWLRAVIRALPSLRIKIGGGRWDRAVAGTDLAPYVLGRPLTGDFYSRAIQASRVNIALHMGPAGPQQWQDFVSMRTFEIPACKGFMLHIDNPELRTLFEPEQEIGVFETETQLCEKILYYLERPDLRAAMIERAYARAVPAYSYYARAGEIARKIEAARTEQLAVH